jgi:hypothetical protein
VAWIRPDPLTADRSHLTASGARERRKQRTVVAFYLTKLLTESRAEFHAGLITWSGWVGSAADTANSQALDRISGCLVHRSDHG